MDSRHIAALMEPWWTTLDRQRMTATVALDDERIVTVSFKYEVCRLCGGRGSHVNPSIDADGLTADDFANDPDFEESYFRGDYDVTCNACHGDRVVPEIDPERCDLTVLKAVHDKQAAEYDHACQSAIEREMGY